jgi:DNA transposition AAA+ family ATPase
MSEINRLKLIEQSKFTNERPDVVRTKLKGLVDAGEIKLREIERKTTFSSAVISQALNDKYPGDVEKVNDALIRFYRWWVATNFVIQTGVLHNIQGAMDLGWKRFEIVSIVAPFGRGKSKATSHFVATNNYAIYLELPSITTISSLLIAIGEALNIKGLAPLSRHDKLMTIVNSLQRTPRMIVIDEADNLVPSTLAVLKDIWGDLTAQRCCIVLVGTDRLIKILRHPDLGYLNRRIGIRVRVGDITVQEAKSIVDIWPHDLDADDIKKAYGWSMSRFGVASLVSLMGRACDVMQMKKETEIDSQCLDDAYGFLVD